MSRREIDLEDKPRPEICSVVCEHANAPLNLMIVWKDLQIKFPISEAQFLGIVADGMHYHARKRQS